MVNHLLEYLYLQMVHFQIHHCYHQLKLNLYM